MSRIVKEEEVQLSEGALLTIAREAEGSMRDAQSLLDQVISYGGKAIQDKEVIEALGLIDRKVLLDTLDAIAGQDPGRCMDLVAQIYHFGYDLQHFCRELLQYLRHLLLLKVSRNPEPLVTLPKEELELLKKQAERFQLDQLNYLFSLLLKGEEEVSQSTFPRTMLEMTLIRMATLKPIRSIDEILKKLEGLNCQESFPEGERKSPPRFTQEKEKVAGQSEEPAEIPAPSVEDFVPENPVAESEEEMSIPDEEVSGENPPAKEEGGVSSPTGDEEAWKALLDFTRARNPIIGSFLALGELIHLGQDRIEIGFEKDSFHYDRMLEKENRSLFEQVCRDYLQRKAKVVITPMDQKPHARGGKAYENKNGLSKTQDKPLEKANGKSPLVQEALRLFDGKIIEE
jgi:DNA polymerase III subunit gamma/tau